MLEVNVLRRCFGYTAVIFAFVFVAILPLCRISVRVPHFDVAGPLLIASIILMTVLPAVLTVVNGTAWWMIRKGNPNARRWSIAASICLLLMSVPFFLTGGLMLHFGAARILLYQDLAGGFVLSALGIVGLTVFAQYDGLKFDPAVCEDPVSKIPANLLIPRAENPSPVCQ
jgi:hypothetical protein